MASKRTPAKQSRAAEPEEIGSTMISMRVRTDHLEQMRAEAARQRLPLATWIKQCVFVALDKAAAEKKKGK